MNLLKLAPKMTRKEIRLADYFFKLRAGIRNGVRDEATVIDIMFKDAAILREYLEIHKDIERDNSYWAKTMKSLRIKLDEHLKSSRVRTNLG